MFASIRKYNVRRGSAEHLARRVREGFVPMMRQMEGFRGYYLLDGGPDVLITISIFDSADEAFASNEKAADWVRNNVLEFTKGMPEVMVGDDWRGEIVTRVLQSDGDFRWHDISDLSDSQQMALCLGDAFLCWSRIACAAVCKRAWLATVPHSAAAAACH